MYTVVTSGELDSLIFEVNKLLQEGWQATGGILLRVYSDGCTNYYQAMTLGTSNVS
jgi:hypothetical protein